MKDDRTIINRFTAYMNEGIENVKRNIDIRKFILDFRIMNLQTKIDGYDNYLYEAHRRKDIETKDAII